MLTEKMTQSDTRAPGAGADEKKKFPGSHVGAVVFNKDDFMKKNQALYKDRCKIVTTLMAAQVIIATP